MKEKRILFFDAGVNAGNVLVLTASGTASAMSHNTGVREVNVYRSGYGGSKYSVRNLRDVAHLMHRGFTKKADDERPKVLVGWSGGCLSMAAYAAKYPQDGEVLVLYAPPCPYQLRDDSTRSWALARLAENLSRGWWLKRTVGLALFAFITWLRFRWYTAEELAKIFAKKLGGADAEFLRSAAGHEVMRQMKALQGWSLGSGIFSDFRLAASCDDEYLAALKEIGHQGRRVIIAHGTDDVAVGMEHSRKVTKIIEGTGGHVTLLGLTGRGHFAIFEDLASCLANLDL